MVSDHRKSNGDWKPRPIRLHIKCQMIYSAGKKIMGKWAFRTYLIANNRTEPVQTVVCVAIGANYRWCLHIIIRRIAIQSCCRCCFYLIIWYCGCCCCCCGCCSGDRRGVYLLQTVEEEIYELINNMELRILFWIIQINFFGQKWTYEWWYFGGASAVFINVPGRPMNERMAWLNLGDYLGSLGWYFSFMIYLIQSRQHDIYLIYRATTVAITVVSMSMMRGCQIRTWITKYKMPSFMLEWISINIAWWINI